MARNYQALKKQQNSWQMLALSSLLGIPTPILILPVPL
jgi:hypothetical protein